MAGVTAATGTATRSIVSILKSPCQVATNLNWRKFRANILSVRLSKESIELAVASHPECYEPIHPLPSIPLRIENFGEQRLLCGSVADELRVIVNEWNICGMVVSWPVRKETGRCGAACGRVLRALDQLHNNTRVGVGNGNDDDDDDNNGHGAKNHDLFNPHSRLVCLWDERHRQSDEDAWGRAPTLGHVVESTIGKTSVHFASREQYENDREHTSTVVDVWNDYRRVHWPDIEDTVIPPSNHDGYGSIANTNMRRAFNNGTVGDGWVAHHRRDDDDDDDDDEREYKYRNAIL